MLTQNLLDQLKRATDMLSDARYTVVFTGAGISTPSGIPDFRGDKNGLWQRYDPMQVASRTAFYHSPDLFFNWFRPLFITSMKAVPNPAHLALASLEKSGYLKSIITQNIDGLHQKAGSTHVLELHGTALSFTCSKCRSHYTSDNVFEQFANGKLIPLCPTCESVLKPDVVLFEEGLPQDIWEEAEKEALKADLMIVIGSSLEVFPANTIPQAAMRNGCKMIINNFTTTPLDGQADLHIQMDAAEFLPRVLDQIL